MVLLYVDRLLRDTTLKVWEDKKAKHSAGLKLMTPG